MSENRLPPSRTSPTPLTLRVGARGSRRTLRPPFIYLYTLTSNLKIKFTISVNLIQRTKISRLHLL